jgi:PAS domain S-box-containing protein
MFGIRGGARTSTQDTRPFFEGAFDPAHVADQSCEVLVQDHEPVRVLPRPARPSVEERGEEDRDAKLERAALAIPLARAGRKRYGAVLESLGTASLLSDRRGEVLRVNEAARRLLGVEGVSVLGRPIAQLFDRAAGEQLDRALARIDREPIAMRLRLADGSGQWLQVQARAVSAKDVFWTLSADASAPKADLARRLADKDEVIDRLRRRVEELERDSRTKDKFIAVLAHDLRAPLNAILGWTQLLRRELLDAVGRERALATIERNARSQAALIEELLDVTRLNEGRLPLEISACDVGLVVRRTMEAALPEATSRGVRLLTNVHHGVTVAGDRARLEQIVNNLLSNALKFTPPGGTIEVTVAREAGLARIAVRDSGRGIEPSQLPHVFKWLHQGYDAGTTREGLGLGLFIVRRLVELHGGTVRADSEGPGRGATFTVVLPCCDPALVSAPSSAILPELGELDGLHVLVVEDELDAVELLSSVLSARGARVTSVRAGAPALSLALADPPEVIVTDLGLPDMDGFELVRRIRAVHGGSVGIVALTGFTAKDVACGPSTGFDERLTKPVDIPRLIEAVESAARRARMRSG